MSAKSLARFVSSGMAPHKEVAGIDVGLTLVNPTSGVCRTGPSGEVITHTYIDRLSRLAFLGGNLRFSVPAIDAPVLPEGQLHYHQRSCEKVFVWGALTPASYQYRKSPHFSNPEGFRSPLRSMIVEHEAIPIT